MHSVALAVTPTALLVSVIHNHLCTELAAEHTRFYLAYGATASDVRRRFVRSAALVALPYMQVLTVALCANLIFVEALTSSGGLGSLTLRAAKRVDFNLVLGLVVFYALVTSTIDTLARVARSRLQQ
jgi:ABC-type dipeptide/oligopeptide/nickel transport system permease component